MLSDVTLGGEVDGVRLLSPKTIDLIFDEQADGVDLVLGVPLRLGIGYGLPRAGDRALRAGRADLLLGWLGRLDDHHGPRAAADVGYMMNRMAPGIVGSDRSEAYVRAVYAALS